MKADKRRAIHIDSGYTSEEARLDIIKQFGIYSRIWPGGSMKEHGTPLGVVD